MVCKKGSFACGFNRHAGSGISAGCGINSKAAENYCSRVGKVSEEMKQFCMEQIDYKK